MDYLLTILVAAILLILVALIIRHLIREWKSGHGLCGGDCQSCGHCSALQALAENTDKPSACGGNCATCQGCPHRKGNAGQK